MRHLRKGGAGAALFPYAALALIAGAYLWEIALQSGVPVARDVQMFFVPQKHLLWEALQQRHIPHWTPYVGAGAPFLANFQSGVFYPPHWVYGILPFFTAFNFLILLHFTLGGLFAFLLGRRLGLAPVAGFVGAVTWMLGGYFASLLNLLNALQGATWAPALAWAVLRHLDHRTRVSLASLAAVATLTLLAGEPQSFLFSCAAAGLVAALALSRGGATRRAPARLAGELVLVVAIVAGLAMIQILPTLEFLSVSGRGAGLTFAEAAAYRLHPSRLVQLLVPPDYRDPVYAFGVRAVLAKGDPWLFSLYLGALWPILAYLAWRNPDRRRETITWTGVAIAGVVVALGPNTPVFGWLFHHVPGFDTFRFPEKYFFLTAFAAALIAGFGAEAALDRRRAARRADRVVGTAWAVLLVAGLVAFRANPEAVRTWAEGFGSARTFQDFGFAYRVWSENLAKLILLTLLGLLLLRLHRGSRLSTRWLGLLLATLVTVDLSVAHRNLNPVVEREFYEREPLILRHVPLEEVRRDYRYRATRFDSLAATLSVVGGVPVEAQKWLWHQVMAPNIGQTWRVLQQDAWDAIKVGGFVDERDLQRVIPDMERRWNLLRLHSVKYVYSMFPIDTAEHATALVLDSLPGRLYEVRRPLPRAYIAPQPVLVPDRVAAINEALHPRFDPWTQVVLIDPGAARRAPGEAAERTRWPGSAAPRASSVPVPVDSTRPLAASIVEDAQTAVTVRIPEGAEGFLVLTDSHYPGWRAFVDGEERAVRVANFFFRGVPIRRGDREVRFEYRSRPFERGLRITLLTFVLGSLGFVLAGRRRGRRGRSWRRQEKAGTHAAPAP